MRQGLFLPLRLLFAAFLAPVAGVYGATVGWSLITFCQCLWLKSVLGDVWRPLYPWPYLPASLQNLLSRGFPFYASNLLATITFYPLLVTVASSAGLQDIGYLRVGQIVQQLFAFLPATLLPVLFLQLRGKRSFVDQVLLIEKPFRIIWNLLLVALLLYCSFDQLILPFLFGADFDSALLPTRLLILTALLECLAQIVFQPLLAAGRMRTYALWQNGAATFTAVLGWFWIPSAGIASYLTVRLLYVTIPLVGLGIPVLQHFQKPNRLLPLLLLTVILPAIFLLPAFNLPALHVSPSFFFLMSIIVSLCLRKDLRFLCQALRPTIRI